MLSPISYRTPPIKCLATISTKLTVSTPGRPIIDVVLLSVVVNSVVVGDVESVVSYYSQVDTISTIYKVHHIAIKT